MPATRDNSKNAFSRTISNSSISNSAKVFHQATNLMPPSPPLSPTGVAPPFGTSRSSSTNSFSRQNSQTSGKYS